MPRGDVVGRRAARDGLLENAQTFPFQPGVACSRRIPQNCRKFEGNAQVDLAAPLLQSLDRMNCGALVLDGAGAVLRANGHASRLLSLRPASPDGDGITGHAGRDALRKLMARAGSQFRAEEDAWISVANDDGVPLIVHSIPVAGGTADGPRAVLVLVDLNQRPLPAASVLQRLFDLSPAEARLAIGLARGRTLGEFAEETGVSSATLRTQLSSVFTKTQTRRQPELIALLARVAILP